MISSFRHAGLERFAETGSCKGIQPRHATRLKKLLLKLDQVHSIKDLGERGALHLLSRQNPETKGKWSIRVDQAWRLVFGFDHFDNGNVVDLDYLNYH